jgi:hypothetical protein
VRVVLWRVSAWESFECEVNVEGFCGGFGSRRVSAFDVVWSTAEGEERC